MFAEDSSIFTHDKLSEIHKMMAIDLKKLNIWFQAIPMILNIDKNKYVLFTMKRRLE